MEAARYADFELNLHQREGDTYAVELRFSAPGSDVRVQQLQRPSVKTQFDWVHLREIELDYEAYGKYLWKCLFADTELYSQFLQAQSVAQQLEMRMRFRLNVDYNSAALQTIRWEMLRDIKTGDLLLTNQRILFSRYLNSSDWRPVAPHARGALKALVMVANPSNLTEYSLAPVQVDAELATVQKNLDAIPIIFIGKQERATLNALTEHLGKGIDILYLICHGALKENQALLWLEKDDGTAHVVYGSELATRIKELQRVPLLSVFASCQSAGTGSEAQSSDQGALAALGPQLVQVGVPAVLAMQGNIAMQTVAAFMPVFFRELQTDGQIDKALSVARGVIRERPDWWVPVLFLRLESGKLWEEALFSRPTTPQTRVPVGDIAAELSEWKTIHTEAQNLLFSLPSVESDIRLYKQEPSESAAKKIEDTWFRTREPKVQKIRRSFVDLKLVRHTSIQELLEGVMHFAS